MTCEHEFQSSVVILWASTLKDKKYSFVYNFVYKMPYVLEKSLRCPNFLLRSTIDWQLESLGQGKPELMYNAHVNRFLYPFRAWRDTENNRANRDLSWMPLSGNWGIVVFMNYPSVSNWYVKLLRVYELFQSSSQILHGFQIKIWNVRRLRRRFVLACKHYDHDVFQQFFSISKFGSIIFL